ncbi:MAG: hypothetical protein HW383_613 [Candidatus Magasanikbacteria bacterium]|nr:hypothetical protein [Candidatus Magasanikbacteria bacterium]
MAKKPKTVGAPTLKNLDIAAIRDDTVILRDGTLRAVLLASSINFALKSDDEQTALISSYVGFLNTLDFPLEIIIHSRRLDIEPYLNRLAEKEKKQTNELLRVQIADYRAFVAELVKLGEIMTKRFYVAVPYDPVTGSKKSFWQRFQEIFKAASSVRLKEERFRTLKGELDTRIGQVAGQLTGMGIDNVRLDTQGLIELYYTVYNPDTFMSQKMAPVQELHLEESYGV